MAPGTLSGGLCAGTNLWAAQSSSEFLHWPWGHLSPSSLLGRPPPPRSVGIFKDLNFFFYKLILFLLISNIIKLMLLILRFMSLGILS